MSFIQDENNKEIYAKTFGRQSYPSSKFNIQLIIQYLAPATD